MNNKETMFIDCYGLEKESLKFITRELGDLIQVTPIYNYNSKESGVIKKC